MRKVILDTDPGIGSLGADIDDGLAIVMALNSPELEVLGLTIVNGNVPCEEGVINALNLLQVMGRSDVPVYRGALRPLITDMQEIRDTFSAILKRVGRQKRLPLQESDIALKPQSEHAIDFIINEVHRFPGDVTMICIGPLTNLAMAIRKDPTLISEIKEVIFMGGGWTQPLDCYTPVAEFNMFCDPEAAKIVLHSGVPLTMVGFELAKKVMMTPEHLAILRERNTPTSNFIAQMAEPWFAFMEEAFGLRGCYLPDPLAVGFALNAELFTVESMYVDIETQGAITRGMTVVDRGKALQKRTNRPNVRVCTDVDTRKFMDIFLSLLY